MARFQRVRLFALPGLASGLLFLAAPEPGVVLSAQSDPASGATQPWTSADQPVADAPDWSDSVPAHIAVVDGTATLERDGALAPAQENVPLLTGDRVRTERGRVDLVFADGSVLDLDDRTTIDVLSDALMRLEFGRVRLTLARGATPAADYRLDAAGTTTFFHGAGQYRVTADPDGPGPARVSVTVIRGAAELGTPSGRTLIRPGYEAAASAEAAPSAPYAANVASADAFDRWADALWQDRASADAARYLPAEVRPYGGLLDRAGSWDYDVSLGYVWYPRVDATWRPYYQGEWSYVSPFGWTWIGLDRWSWATDHYGRWGVNGARWYWIPGARWAPAWVSWATAPGYLSWCPLGYDNRALISIGLGYGSSARAWTAVRLGRFDRTIVVNGRNRVSSAPGDVRFIERRVAPIRPATAVRADHQPFRGPAQSSRTPFATNRPSAANPRFAGRDHAVNGSAWAPSRRSAQTPASGAPPRSTDWRPASPAASPRGWSSPRPPANTLPSRGDRNGWSTSPANARRPTTPPPRADSSSNWPASGRAAEGRNAAPRYTPVQPARTTPGWEHRDVTPRGPAPERARTESRESTHPSGASGSSGHDSRGGGHDRTRR